VKISGEVFSLLEGVRHGFTFRTAGVPALADLYPSRLKAVHQPGARGQTVIYNYLPLKGAKLLHPTTGERLCEMNGKGIGHEAPRFDQQTRHAGRGVRL
jgi:hypothetical protein